ncbi:hypothetical protein [Staphylococcus cohnii]|uniref:hypothetical protein n=1 Tax=Staphylococcus cohnii TaxID=29382 RepID=UPI001D023210|nr:hypothetical protein [Staphylococcus cohnii]
MWLRFSVQLIMSILMFIFIYQQVNQSHFDFWFIIYYLFFIIYGCGFILETILQQKVGQAFMLRKSIC